MKKVRSKKLEVRSKRWSVVICIMFLLISLFSLYSSLSAAQWTGVDESVVEKYSEEHGRAAREPLINTDQGDLLLFVFLLAGATGGFIGGYYWRDLMEKRPRNSSVQEHRTDTE